MGQWTWPDDLRLDPNGPRAGDPPNAGGRGHAHQLRLRRYRPADSLRDDSWRSLIPCPEHQPAGMDHVAAGQVGARLNFEGPLGRLLVT